MDRAFLEWLRATTEDVWRTYVPRDFTVGLDWQPGTSGRGGLSDAEIASADDRFGLTFPPDNRLLPGDAPHA